MEYELVLNDRFAGHGPQLLDEVDQVSVYACPQHTLFVLDKQTLWESGCTEQFGDELYLNISVEAVQICINWIYHKRMPGLRPVSRSVVADPGSTGTRDVPLVVCVIEFYLLAEKWSLGEAAKTEALNLLRFARRTTLYRHRILPMTLPIMLNTLADKEEDPGFALVFDMVCFDWVRDNPATNFYAEVKTHPDIDPDRFNAWWRWQGTITALFRPVEPSEIWLDQSIEDIGRYQSGFLKRTS